MGTTRYVALIRGINVGGKNVIPMAELRAALTGAGYDDVGTYIQSGNVLLSSAASARGLETALEGLLADRFGVVAPVVVRSHRRLRAVVSGAPAGFGSRPDTFHSDVVFLKAPLSVPAAMAAVRCRDGVDQAWAGPGVVYFARLSARRAQSRMTAVVGTPEYRMMTIRNWATTTRLLALLDG